LTSLQRRPAQVKNRMLLLLLLLLGLGLGLLLELAESVVWPDVIRAQCSPELASAGESLADPHESAGSL
jgi:hypothetical protein